MAEAGREGLSASRQLLENVHEAALGTVEDGKPFVSAVGFIFLPNAAPGTDWPAGGAICLLLSDLSRHTRNLKQCPEAGFLVAENKPGIPVHEKKRASFQGRIERVDDKMVCEKLKQEYLKIFPRSEVFFTLPDFYFYELKVSNIHWIGGFGKAATWP